MPLNRKGRYNELIRRHFLPEEARALSKVRTLKYTEIRRMTASRQLLYNRFVRKAGLKHGDSGFPKEYTDYVRQWYKSKDLTTFSSKLQRTISPWDWFDKVSYRLPEEQRYTKQSRRKNAAGANSRESAAMKAARMRWIHELKETIMKNPNRAVQLVPQILRLGGRVPPAFKRKAGLL